ncbi:histidine phosphatase family protein [Tranquillimonas rosea]|uniref:histidine phosphatase family protein n=1 Tax=Tranquillimonas rosea TaxID=641238 RepID=UPI003BAD60D2
MTARLWWVRHGPTHASGMVGWSDVAADLSDAAALGRLAAVLPREAAVVSSDLGRAVTTADAIADGRPRLPHDPDLREINFGTWEMRRHDEITGDEAQLIRRFWDEPGEVTAPEGESWNDVCRRVSAAADRLATRGGEIVAVAHMGAILTQVQRATGFDGYRTFGQPIANLSVTTIVFDGSWRMESVNRSP